jgi:hypothetical protein
MSLLTLIAGCTFLIIPKSTNGSGEDIIYLRIHDSGVTKMNTSSTSLSPPPSTVSVNSIDDVCKNLNIPIFNDPPVLVMLAPEQRSNRTVAENAVVDYALALRNYAALLRNTSTHFFNEYNRACKSVSPPLIK